MNIQTQCLFEALPSLEGYSQAYVGSTSNLTWELQETPSGGIDCSRTSVDCASMTREEEKRIKPGKTPRGDFELRRDLMKHQDIDFALQIIDYDVKDWRAKPKHHEALAKVFEFLNQRATEIVNSADGIELTITGKASRTGAKDYNDLLSCKRAICVVKWFQDFLNPRLLKKIKFTISGKGFLESNCKGRECELPEHRSVLIIAHRPGVQPPPVPIIPPGWNKYKIRCCSFKTESLGEALLGDLLSKGVDQLPEPLKSKLGQGMGKSLLGKLIKNLAQKLGKGLGVLIDKAVGEGILKFIPIEFIKDTGVFQIVEREVTQPKEIVLCYQGFGFRVKLPRQGILPGFVKIGVVKRWLKEALKEAFNLKNDPGIDEKLEQYLNFKAIPTIETTTPGLFTDFDVDRNVTLKVFAGGGSALKGIEPGKIHVGFGKKGSRPWNAPDPQQRPKIRCQGCTDSIVLVKVGSSMGFEVIAPTEGELAERGCKCVEVPTKVSFTKSGVAQPTLQSRGKSLRHIGLPSRPRKSSEAEQEWLFEAPLLIRDLLD